MYDAPRWNSVGGIPHPHQVEGLIESAETAQFGNNSVSKFSVKASETSFLKTHPIGSDYGKEKHIIVSLPVM